MKSKKHVTIYQVALDAGVAISTVSKVLSNKSGIAPETRNRVHEAIRKLGYVPSLAARGLPRGRTGIVAAIFAFHPELLFGDPYLMQNLLGIKTMLDEVDYNLLLSTASENNPASSFDRLMRSRYFDGAIILETSDINELSLYNRLMQQSAPWVVMGFPGEVREAHAVYADEYNGGRLAADHLLALGHRRIGLITASPRPSGVDERLRGFYDRLAKEGLQIEPSLHFAGTFEEKTGLEYAPLLLNRPDRPTGIFCVNDRVAVGVLRWAFANGLSAPRDFSLVGFDGIPLSAQYNLTTIQQPGEAIGARAARMVMDLVEGRNVPLHEVLPVKLIRRGTTGPLS